MSQIQKMYSVHDQAANAYLAPFFMANDLLAIRTFAALVNDPQHLFSQSAQDFNLFCFGSFDVTAGTMELEKAPRIVRSAIALIKREPSEGQINLALETAAHQTEDFKKGNGGYEDFNRQRAETIKTLTEDK